MFSNRLAIVALAIMAINPASGAVAFVARAKANAASTTPATTAAVDTTGAVLLVAYCTTFGSTAIAVSDSNSNTWVALTALTFGNSKSQLFYSFQKAGGALVVGAGHTFTVAGNFPEIVVHAFSGSALASPLDQQTAGGTGTTTTVQPGSLTPSGDGYLLVTGENGQANTATPTINSGFSVPFGDPYGGATEGGWASYLIQTPAAAVNPTWANLNGGTANTAVMASFKVASTGACTITLLGAGKC